MNWWLIMRRLFIMYTMMKPETHSNNSNQNQIALVQSNQITSNLVLPYLLFPCSCFSPMSWNTSKCLLTDFTNVKHSIKAYARFSCLWFPTYIISQLHPDFHFLWNGMRNAIFAVSEVAIQEIYGLSSAHRLYGYAYMFWSILFFSLYWQHFLILRSDLLQNY